MARRNFSDFIKSFNDGFDTVNKVGKDYEISKLAREKETPVYTAGQGADLEAISNAKDSEGKPYYSLGSDQAGKYTVAPNFQDETGGAPADYTPSTVAAKGVSYLGQSFDAPLNDSQRMGARQMAISGVMEKYGDPEGAIRYRQQAKQGDLADAQIADIGAARERRAITDKQADTRFANDQETFARTNTDANQQSIAAREQALRDSAFRDVAGRFSQGGWDAVPEIYKGYNDGNTATVQKDDKGGATISLFDKDGKPAGQQTFRNKMEFVTGAIAKMDPKLWASKVESQAKDLQAQSNWDATNARADKSLGIQQAQLGIQQSTAAMSNNLHGAQLDQIREVTANKKELNSIHREISDAIDSGDSKTEALARKKLLTYTVGAKGTGMTKLESEANLYYASGKAKSMSDALEMAHQKVQSSPKDDYIKLTTGAMPRSPDDLERDMTTLHGSNWKDKISPRSADSKPITQAEFDKLPSGAIYTNSQGGRSQKP